MSEKEFYGEEWDLANIAANSWDEDSYLLDLVELAEVGLGSVVGVLANGMVIVGALASGRAMAEELDRQREVQGRAAQRPDDVSPEDWDERVRFWARRNAEAFDAADAKRKAVEERWEAEGSPEYDYDDRPRGLAREVTDNRVRTTLTLVDAQIVAPAQNGILKIPVIRIPLRRVSGWWSVPTDADGKASFRLFAVEDL